MAPSPREDTLARKKARDELDAMVDELLARLADALRDPTPERRAEFKAWLARHEGRGAGTEGGVPEGELPSETLRRILKGRGVTGYKLERAKIANADAIQRFM